MGGSDLRHQRAQAVVIEGVARNVGVRAGRRFGDVGQANAEIEQQGKLVRSESAWREPDCRQHGPEPVTRSSIVGAFGGRHGTRRRATENEAQSGLQKVRQDVGQVGLILVRVRACPDVAQARRIDAGVTLGRRQAGVTEEFLNGAQVGAAGEKMRCEAVSEGMRGGVLR